MSQAYCASLYNRYFDSSFAIASLVECDVSAFASSIAVLTLVSWLQDDLAEGLALLDEPVSLGSLRQWQDCPDGQG
jgi:hypothetical protein